jgi:hypothetical protein
MGWLFSQNVRYCPELRVFTFEGRSPQVRMMTRLATIDPKRKDARLNERLPGPTENLSRAGLLGFIGP